MMNSRHFLALLASPFLIGADDLPDYDERTLEIDGREPVELTINDQPARLLVAPEAASIPSINNDAAERFEFEHSMIGFRFRQGNMVLELSSDVARYEMGSGRFRRRSAFGPAADTQGADGTVGPGGLPFGRVRFRMKDEGAEERPFVFDLEKLGRRSVGIESPLGEHELHVTFSLSHPESVLTASAGSIVANQHSGHFAGETRPMSIGYGIERPVRPLSLSVPLLLNDLEVRNLVVRTQDFGDATDIAEEAFEPDPNEIVVTGNSDDDLPWLLLTIGLDTIGHCSSLTYDFEEETITLMCPEQS